MQIAAPDGSTVLRTRIGSKSLLVVGTFPVQQLRNYTLTVENKNEQDTVKLVAAFGHAPMYDAGDPYLQALTISTILLMTGSATTVTGFGVYFVNRKNWNDHDRSSNDLRR